MIHKYIFLSCWFILLLACSGSQRIVQPDQEQEIVKKDTGILLLVDDLFSGEYRPDNFPGVNWSDKGEYFTLVDGGQIVQFEPGKGVSLVVSKEQLTPEGKQNPLAVANYFWSETGAKLMIYTNTKRVWRENTRGDYWVLDLNSDELVQLGASLPESSLMFAKFSADGTQAAYVSGHNLYLEDLNEHTINQLTFDGSEDIINGTFDWAYEEELFCKDGFRWSPEGQQIAFWQINASAIGDYLMLNTTDSIYPFTIPVEYPKVGYNPSPARIGIYHLNNNQINWLDIPGDPVQHYLPRMQWINEDELIIQQLNRKQNHLILWRYQISNGRLSKFYEEEDPAWVDIVFMDVTSPWQMLDLPMIDQALFRMTEKDGWRHLYKLPLDGLPEICITTDEWDVARYYNLDMDDGTGYILASPENATQRYLFQIDMDGEEGAKRITPDEFTGVNTYNISASGRYAIHTFSSATTPPVVSLISLPDHQVISTFVDNEAYQKKMQTIAMPDISFFQVSINDSVTLDGQLLKPYNFDPARKYPVIFDLYGEPAGQTAVDQWDSGLWPVLMSQKGYLYISIDNRGTPCLKGRAWRKSIYRKLGQLNASDQAAACREIIKWDFVDSSRIGVWGHSGGGAMTLNLLFQYPDLYHTGIAIAAVTNQLYYDNIYQERYMGLPSENLQDFIDGSPVSYAKNLAGNLLYIHGTADDNVHYQNAEALINELVKHKKQFSFMSYPGRSHGIWEGENTLQHRYQLMTDFFLKHNPPGPK